MLHMIWSNKKDMATIEGRVATAKLIRDAPRADTLARYLTEHSQLLMRHRSSVADGSE